MTHPPIWGYAHDDPVLDETGASLTVGDERGLVLLDITKVLEREEDDDEPVEQCLSLNASLRPMDAVRLATLLLAAAARVGQ